MLVIDNTHTRRSNITGLSLVLFLFLSLLSMMAAYEAGKPTDDLRNNVVASFHEYSTQVPDPESSDHVLVVKAARERLPTGAIHYQTSVLSSFSVPAPKHFDARGPPAQGFAAS
jgi:hypothetical protein